MPKVNISFKATIKGGPSKYQMAADFRNYARAELAKECRRYFDIANKRINRLNQQEILSPALHSVMNSGGKFYASGKDLKQLQHEYARCISFLNMETSSVTGAKSYERRIEAKVGHALSREQHKLLFNAYRQIERASPGGVQAYGSERLVQYLADEITSEDSAIMAGVGSQDFEAAIEKAVAEMIAEYEKVMDEFNQAFKDSFSF